MRKAGLFSALLALSVCLAQALPLGTVPRTWDRDGDPYAGAQVTPGRNQEDSVLADVHANSCYISSVRCLDYDPAADAMNLIFRGTDGNMYNLTSLDHGNTYTRMGPIVSGSVRYPSGMCDLGNQLPFAFFNRGWSAGDEGAYVTWDDLGYGGGLWATPVCIDTTGQGVPGGGIYVVNGVKGANGRIHVCANYWGDYTPDAAFYYYSDDNGYTWSSRFLVYYDLHGTEDSLALFNGGPVVHDSVAAGYVNQLQIFCSYTGDTVMIGTCAGHVVDGGADTVMQFFYRMSYDSGSTWTPLTWAPYAGQLGWPSMSYDLGIAVDKEGYPHFATWLFMDTTAAGGYGPNTGLVDYHQTASGWVATLIHATGENGDYFPSFANFGLDEDGILFVSYRDQDEGDATMNIWAAYSNNNGASYNTYQVTDDNGGYDYPHIAMHVRAPYGFSDPIYYQRVNTGFMWWWYGGVSGESAGKIRKDKLALDNRPNPARGRTEILFELPAAGEYGLKLYNIAGQEVRRLQGRGAAGRNAARLDLRGLAGGTYLCALEAAGQRKYGKITILK